MPHPMPDRGRRLNTRDVQLLIAILDQNGYAEVDYDPLPPKPCNQCRWPGTRGDREFCDACEQILRSVISKPFFLKAQLVYDYEQRMAVRKKKQGGL